MAKAKAKAATGSMIAREAVEGYKVSDVKTASGRKSVDCDDAVARKMRGKSSMADLKKIADESGLLPRWNGTGDFKDKTPWKDLNPGQARMALGNAMRGLERAKKAPKTKKKAA